MTETEEFLGDVDEDLEAMQGTVYLLQQELKDAKERLQQQQLELDQLRARAAITGGVNSAPAAACSELPATVTVNMVTSDSSDLPMKQAGKTSSEPLRTDSSRIPNENFVRKPSFEGAEASPVYENQRNAPDDGNKFENMDVDSSETLAKCSHTNDATVPMQHMNDDTVSTDQLASDSGLRRTMADRFRTASKVGGTELTASDYVPNGTDDDKAVAVAGN